MCLEWSKMDSLLDLSEAKQVQDLKVREKVLVLEEKMKALPGAMIGDCFPLKHTFVDGAYVREITMPKGAIVVSKIHKVCHPYFILKGDVSVLTEEGVTRLKAPYSGITLAGTKRVLYMHEETIWVTVHVTKEKNLDLIEEEIISRSFEEANLIPDYAIKLIQGGKICLG